MKQFLYLQLCGLLLISFKASSQEPDSSAIRQSNAPGSDSSFNRVYTANRSPYIATNYTRLPEGQTTGLQATNGGGQPGAAAGFLVRGITVSAETSGPMVLLDGLPYFGDPNAIAPSDIASITVLKDAAAMVRYGGRAANGIVDIKTKTGSARGLHLEAEAKAGIATRALPDYETIRSEKDYYEISWEGYRNSIAGYGYSLEQAGEIASGRTSLPGLVDHLGYNVYNVPNDQLIDPVSGKLNENAKLKYSDGDWRKAIQRAALRHEYNIAASSNGGKGSYYLSTGYLNEGGYIKSTSYERGSMRFNGHLKPFRWLRAGIHASGILASQHYALSDGSRNPVYAMRAMAPIYPVHYYNNDGQREPDPVTGKDKFDWGDPRTTPASSIAQRNNENAAGRLLLDEHRNRTTSWNLLPYVEATLLRQFTLSFRAQYNQWNTKGLDSFNPYYGFSSVSDGYTLNSTTKLHYYILNPQLGWHRTLGKHLINIEAGYERLRQDDQIYTVTATGNTGASPSTSRDVTSWVTQSTYANARYGFAGKYFVSGGFSREGTSVSPPEIKFSNYWAIGAEWHLGKESFLQQQSWLDQLLLRVNYGRMGKIHTKLLHTGIHQFSAGLDLALLQSRIALSFDYFDKHAGDDLVLFGPLRGTRNMQNRGIELGIKAAAVRSAPVSWDIMLNFTYLQNKITSINDVLSTIYASLYLHEAGKSAYDYYLPGYAGVDPLTGAALYYTQRGTTSDYSSLTVKDYVSAGSALPKFFGSLNQEWRYRQFGLQMMISFSIGGKYYDQVYQQLMNPMETGQNYSVDILKRWTPEQPDTDVPIMDWMSGNYISTRFLRSASYMNLRCASLSYRLPAEKAQKIKLQSLQLYLAADNLLLISAYKGMDPQASFVNVPGYVYGPARTIVFGVKAGI